MEPIYVYSFPFAAGSRYSYNPLIKESPDWLKWIPLDYPGRGRRIFESPRIVLTEIVQDLKQQLLAHPKVPFVFYGHSMGSLVAYMLTIELIRENGPLPRHLFLSGRGGACIPEKQRNALQMSRAEIVEEVQNMDGDLSLLLQNPKQFDQYEQVLRADVAALDSYDYDQVCMGPLPVKATVFIGSTDIYTPDQAQLWQHDFVEPIDVHVLTGGHFFIIPQAAVIVDIMTKDLQKYQPEWLITDYNLND